MFYLILILALIFTFISQASTSLFIEKYIAKIEPNFADKTISGSTQIHFKKLVYSDIQFPLYGLIIDKVLADSKPVVFSVTATLLKIEITKIKTDGVRQLTIQFHGQPSHGLVWAEEYLYTNYDPCTWMICLDAPGVRVPIEMHLKIPNAMKSVANGILTSTSKDGPSHRTEVWQELRPYSSYLYGFSVGKFNVASEKYGDIELEFLGATDSSELLKTKFKDTQTVIQFFEEMSGVPLPLKKYSQILVDNTEAQEKHGFSILGKLFIDPILKDPTEDWAIVHELAHQWWGNLLTCKSWPHFWLNEGLTVFMTAAYKQKRWGQAAYEKELALAQARYQHAIDAKFDVPLTFAGEYPSGLRIRRAIVYSKGALFLAALRKELGEKKFWKGLKKYTQDHQLKSVESKDFQNAMENAAGKKLNSIFNRWVY